MDALERTEPMTVSRAKALRQDIVNALRPAWVGHGRDRTDWTRADLPQSSRWYWRADCVSRDVMRRLKADQAAGLDRTSYPRSADGARLLPERLAAQMHEASRSLGKAYGIAVEERPPARRRKGQGRNGRGRKPYALR